MSIPARARPDARRGFTVVEACVAALVVTGVLGAACSVMTSVTRGGKKAQDLCSAVQTGAVWLHALDSDLVNIVPERSEADTLQVDDGSSESVRWLRFKRCLVRKRPGRDTAFEVGAGPAALVEYRATRRADGLWQVRRIVDTNDGSIVGFSGLTARDVRFVRLKFRGRPYVRLSALVVASDVKLARHASGDRARDFLVTALRGIPTLAW
jgi:hypothetical protein